MESIFVNILCGLAANALTAVVSRAYKGAKGALKAYTFAETLEIADEKIKLIVQKTVEDALEIFEWEGQPSLEEVYFFLEEPEVASIIEQIFSLSIVSNEETTSKSKIRVEFINLFRMRFKLKIDERGNEIEGLFDLLLKVCDSYLNSAINKGILAAHEAKEIARHKSVMDCIRNIEKNLELIKDSNKVDVAAILNFEKKYREQVVQRHSYITPPNFDNLNKVQINDLYVTPNFKSISYKEMKDISYLKLTTSIYRSVVLGDPGGGKSTLSYKICNDLCNNYSNMSLGYRKKVTPVLVVLRDYAISKKEQNCSILQYIESTSNSIYQISPPKNAFEYLLLNGRIMVIFDGLDELLDTSYRQEVAGNIESFCNLYPSVPVLITSREVGYTQAPLNKDIFKVFRLAPFNNYQVKEYVRKWFSVELHFAEDDLESKISNFMTESDLVADLRANPLMLALMCNIYRGEGYIPRNRPELYEKCSTMLFERWDKSRGIRKDFTFEAYIKPAMMHLAFWIYSDEQLQSGVLEKHLIRETSDYLHNRLYEKKEEAEGAASEFVEFCTGRAWVFTDIGATKEGGKLFQFTHRTFLEYFSAAYLVRHYRTPDELVYFLLPRIALKEWDVVAQLAFQIQSRSFEDAGSDLLEELIKSSKAINSLEERLNILSFAARSLEFIIPSPKVLREIVSICVDINLGNPELAEEKSLILDLFLATRENRDVLVRALQEKINKYIKDMPDIAALLALEVGLDLSLPYLLAKKWNVQDTQFSNVLAGVSNEILKSNSDIIKTLAPVEPGLGLRLYYRGEISMNELWVMHGFDALLKHQTYKIFPTVQTVSLKDIVVRDFLNILEGEIANLDVNSELYQELIMRAKNIGQIVLDNQEKLVFKLEGVMDSNRGVELLRLFQINTPKNNEFFSNDDVEFYFGILVCILLTGGELALNGRLFVADIGALIEVETETENVFLKCVFNLVLILCDQYKMIDLIQEFRELGLNSKQQEFVMEWCNKFISASKIK